MKEVTVKNHRVTLTGFLNYVQNEVQCEDSKKFAWLDYDILWRYVDAEEQELIQKKILEVEEKHINTKKMIIDVKAFKEWLIKYSLKRKYLTIAKFIKETKVESTYSLVYGLILENEKELKSEKIISVDVVRNKRNIKILDSKKMKEFINESH